MATPHEPGQADENVYNFRTRNHTFRLALVWCLKFDAATVRGWQKGDILHRGLPCRGQREKGFPWPERNKMSTTHIIVPVDDGRENVCARVCVSPFSVTFTCGGFLTFGGRYFILGRVQVSVFCRWFSKILIYSASLLQKMTTNTIHYLLHNLWPTIRTKKNDMQIEHPPNTPSSPCFNQQSCRPFSLRVGVYELHKPSNRIITTRTV